ncbi:MAG: hypothetical protein EB168_03950 [Euryarchaeota archaeon]|nr:hypothetical protein [Euryarchaeota archaeon]
MNIVLEPNLTDEVRDKYMLVELDTLQYDDGQAIKSYGVVTKDEITLQDFQNIQMYVDLHNNLIKNYRLKNWKFCEDSLDHLRGKFRGEFDSFYDIMTERVQQLKALDLPSDWSPNVMVKDPSPTK